MANSDDVVGLRSPYAATSQTNAQAYQIEQALREIDTNSVGIVTKADAPGPDGGTGFVQVIPAICQSDGQDNSLQMVPIPKIPFGRLQYGIAAVVIDPVAGDKVPIHTFKKDSSTIDQNTTEPQRAGSRREFNQSDSMIGLPIHTKTPEVWIHLKQDKTIEVYGPDGITVRTDKNRTVQVGQDDSITVNQNQTIQVDQDESLTVGKNRTSSIGQNNDVTIGQNNTINIGQNNSVTIQQNDTVNINGTATITVGGAVTIKAPSVVIDAPSVQITGNLVINGTITAANGTMQAGGGALSMNGEITATGDVQGGGISLTGHTHTAPHGETSGPH